MVAMLSDPGQLDELRKRILGPGGMVPGERIKPVESKVFKRMEVFKGNAGSWFNFLTTLGRNNGLVADALNDVLKVSAAPSAKDLLDKAGCERTAFGQAVHGHVRVNRG